jgi:tetratricopeptide (TPR) repeat protein
LPNLDTLRKTEAHFESLLRRKPGDTRVRIALTNVRGSVGVLCGLRGQAAEREACFQGARDLWEALARQDPRNPEYRDWLATTYDWQSRHNGGQRQLAHALRLGQQAHALWQQLAEEQPGNVTVLQKLADRRWDWLVLRDPAYGEGGMRPFEEARALLDKLLADDPANTSLRQRLALTCLVLGECHHGRRSLPEARRCWRQAYGHYKKLLEAQPDDPLAKLSLALCCSRLMGGQPTDPYYTEAVALFGQAGKRLTALAQQHPGHEWPRHALLETYCALAVCHWQAGRDDEAEHTLQEQVRPVGALVSEDAASPQLGFKLLDCLLRGADSLREAKQHAGALALAREAGALSQQYADTPSRHPAFCDRLALYSVRLSALQCQLGEPAEALTHAEQARRLYAGLHRAAPDMPEYGSGLSTAWVRIAKARWELGRREEALAAFREAAAVQRRVLAQAPSVHDYRLQLSRCYDHLAHWGGLAGDRAGAAAALLEREKLWPNNSEALVEVSRNFRQLAAAVGKGREQLSAEEQTERQRYLAHSERARRAATFLNGKRESAEQTAVHAGGR